MIKSKPASSQRTSKSKKTVAKKAARYAPTKGLPIPQTRLAPPTGTGDLDFPVSQAEQQEVDWACQACQLDGTFTIPSTVPLGSAAFEIALGIHRTVSKKCTNRGTIRMTSRTNGKKGVLITIN